MFLLDDSICDEILFAMENQDLDFRVAAETGEIVLINDDNPDPDWADDAELLDLPAWTSADGFALMESFSAGVGNPEARAALQAALSRGRGVFKAFKKALEPFTELERRWYDFKRSAMLKRVAEWYDLSRVARGLERMGPEPDIDDDLLNGEFLFHMAGRESWPLCQPLFRKGLEETLMSFPKPLVEYEYSAIAHELEEGGQDGLVLAIAEAPGGAIAGMAATRKIFIADSAYGKLSYLYVSPEHRRLGLGRRLAEMTREQLVKDGIPRFIIDLPFVPASFGSSMGAYGYEAFGPRYIKTHD